MASEIGRGAFVLTVDNSKLQSGLSKSKSTLDKFTGSFAGGLVGNVAIGGPIGALVAGVSTGIGKIVDNFKELDSSNEALLNMSASFGVSTEALSQLSFAGRLAGVQFESLGKGLKKVVEIANDDKLLSGLGIRKDQLTGDTVENLGRIADALNQFDGADRAAKGLALFGKAFLGIDPILQMGSGGIRTQAAEADRLGITRKSADAKLIDAAGDALQTASLAWKAALDKITISATPLIKLFGDANKEAAGIVGAIAARFIDDFIVDMNAIGVLAQEAMDKFNGRQIQKAELRKRADLGGELARRGLNEDDWNKLVIGKIIGNNQAQQDALEDALRANRKKANQNKANAAADLATAEQFTTWQADLKQQIFAITENTDALDKLKMGFDKLSPRQQGAIEDLLQNRQRQKDLKEAWDTIDKLRNEFDNFGFTDFVNQRRAIDEKKWPDKEKQWALNQLDVNNRLKPGDELLRQALDADQINRINKQMTGLREMDFMGRISGDEMNLAAGFLGQNIINSFLSKNPSNTVSATSKTEDLNAFMRAQAGIDKNNPQSLLKQALEDLANSDQEVVKTNREIATELKKINDAQGVLIKRAN